MAGRFSQQNQRVRPSSKEDQVVEKAKEHFERTLIEIAGSIAGSVAALEHPSHDEALNYGEIFLRDNVPVMVYLLTQRRYDIVRHFLTVCLDLQSTTYQTRGVFPTSFVEEDDALLADYGQRSIGRITSVDASLWWPCSAGFTSSTAATRHSVGPEGATRHPTVTGSGSASHLRRHTSAIRSRLRVHD